MGIGSGTAALIGGLAGAGGSVASGIMGSNAASDAASQQSAAANQAAQLQYQASQNALDFQKQQYNNSQQELAPWLQSGAGALSNLNYLLGLGQPSALNGNSTTSTGIPVIPLNGGSAAQPQNVPANIPGIGPGSSTTAAGSPINLSASPNTALGAYGSLMQPYGQTFKAPTAADMAANDPGYQARLNLGTQALQQSAAARGNLLTGGTAQALNQFGQDYASNEYNNYYNRAYNTYAQNYNQYQQQQANQYNRLASLAGVGQQTAQQLGTLGQNAANNVSSNLLNTANSMGNSYQNAAAANASGIVGSSNALAGGITGATSGLSNLLAYQSLFGGGRAPVGGSSISSVGAYPIYEES